ncbi:hypothetical protein HYH03_003996 [Edaphochlamys debaryana]|uniref:Uncharacterized protein n=1 Tax=Edaphochlamys debaryana TaxID=47281 RepID=A0A835YCE9_9CHLO|nr:hypothetical protein HYH03_003996 [Edaphochlamys debaryana]|eukprot:KAG2498246.1 hypothetical protein HYH03_003996 [Edaphochlamys debaryana]
MASGTVLISYGEPGADGTPPPRAYFQLIEGKLHMPTIRDYFRLGNVALDGVVYPTDPDGFTFSTFTPNTAAKVTGDALPAGPRPTRILLIRTSEAVGEPEVPGGKRRVTTVEENLGLWTLPPPEAQPRSLAELSSALRSFLQIEAPSPWQFKYRYFAEVVPIASDSALGPAFDHFRKVCAQYSDDESAASQHCRLYLASPNAEMAPRDLIRARITGLLDAAAAHSIKQQDSPPRAPPSALHPAHSQPDGAAAAAAAAALFTNHPHSAAAAALAAAAAAAGYQLPYLPLQPDENGQDGGSGGADGEGDDDGDGEGFEPGPLGRLLSNAARQSGSESAGPGNGLGERGPFGGGGGGGGGGGSNGPPKKESKTRHADGRFKNEAQHTKKMSDMQRKISELFEGAISGMVEVQDHKKILCLACGHTCTAYSAYHTDCVRKHFLRHHESLLRERAVDVGRWRKEYEVSQKVKRQQQAQGQDASGGGLAGLLGLTSSGQLSHAGSGQVISLGGIPLLAAASGDLPLGLLQQLAAAQAQGQGGGVGVPLGTVSALLLQAQNINAEEAIAMQAGGLSGLLPTVSSGVGGGGGPAVLVSAFGGQSSFTQSSGSLDAPGPGPGPGAGSTSASAAAAAAVAAALAPMARMASGTVTTEMPLPPPPPPPPPPPLPPVQSVGEALLAEVAASGPPVGVGVPLPMSMSRAGSQAGAGLPSLASPPVVTTDMSQPSA